MKSYPGRKGAVFQRVINHIPSYEVHIETHIGEGAIICNKRPSMRNIGIEIDPKVIRMWAASDPINFELTHGDAISFLKSYRFRCKEPVYCDPSYLRERRKKYYPLYKYEYTYEQHVELLEIIKSLPCKVMISGYKSFLESTKADNLPQECL